MPQKTNRLEPKYNIILGIKVNSTELVEVLKQVNDWIDRKRRFLIVTPNPEIVMLARHDPVLSSILNSADISLPDGMGLVWASRWLALKSRLPSARRANSPPLDGGPDFGLPPRPGRGLQSLNPGSDNASSQIPNAPRALNVRVSGVDAMEKLVELASKRGWRVFLLGGRPGVAAAAAQRLSHNFQFPLRQKADKFSNFQWDSGPWLEDDAKPVNKIEIEKERKVVEKINKFKPQLLFVGFGAPKQEKWVASNYNKLKTCGTMVVGGAFDYLSGRIPRAPKWLRGLGLEWLFRLFVEPWRWERQLRLLKFIWLVLKYRL